MSEYMIIIGAENEPNVSAVDEKECMEQYGIWAEGLTEKLILGRRLNSSAGKLLPSKKNPVTDGPFVEAKELIAGVILLSADSLEEAAGIAHSCPLGNYFHLFVKKIEE